MAAKYARAAGGNWSTDATWSTTSGGIADTTKPTAADDVILNASSGNVTIDAASVCRSIDASLYSAGKVLTHNAFILSIGDGTAGAGNKALDFSGGFTYTLANATTSEIDFISTSATVQTINFSSKITGNVIFNASSNGSWQLNGTWGTSSVHTGQTVTLTKGTLDTNGQTCHWGLFVSTATANIRTLTLGASTINTYGQNSWTSNSTNLTFNANTSQLNMPQANANIAMTGTHIFNNMTFSGNSVPVITPGASLTFNNLTCTGNATAGNGLAINGNITVTGIFTVTGQSLTNRYLIKTNNQIGTQITITAANVSLTNMDFRDIKGAGAATWSGSSIGDAGGNSTITFTTPVTRYWVGNGGNYSDTTHWSTSDGGGSGASVPLCHDTVNFTANSITSASQTITMDVTSYPGLDFTNVLNNPTLNVGAIGGAGTSIYGSFIWKTGMTSSGAGGGSGIQFSARSDCTLNTQGITQGWATTATLPPAITLSLGADLVCTAGVGNFLLNSGRFNSQNFNMIVNIFQISSSTTNTKVITLGTSTITLTGTSAANQWNFQTATNLTFSGASSTIIFSLASANTRVFAGAGQTYGTLTYTVAGSTGILKITGSNTFNTINYSDITNARTLQFTAGTTNTITTFNVNGTLGKLMTVNSITGGSVASLSLTIGATCTYCAFQDINCNPASSIWAADGTNTNNGNNHNVIFSQPNRLSVGGVG